MKEQLESEKAELEKQVTVNQELIETTQTMIYWLKKRIKLVDAQLKAMPENKE